MVTGTRAGHQDRLHLFERSPLGNPVILHGPGTTDGLIVGPDLHLRPFERALHHKLRSCGFERIVLTDSRHPVYFRDQESVDLSQPASARRSERPPRQRRMSRFHGPLGDRRVGDQPAEPARQRLGLSDRFAVQIFSEFLADRRTRTAVVFPNAETTLTHFDGTRELAGLMDSWFSDQATSNRVVLVFGHDQRSDLNEFVTGLRTFPRLGAIVRAGSDGSLDRRVFRIGPPGRGEIRDLLDQMRLTGGLEIVDHRQLDPLARLLASEPGRLSSWQQRLADVAAQGQPLDLQFVGRQGWLRSTADPTKTAWDQLDELIGLTSVKDHLRDLAAEVVASRRLDERSTGRQASPVLHLVFDGNPGTAKTTVARLVGEIYRDLGLLERGHVVEARAEHLVAGYIGQSAIRTAEVIDSALDGVLFIDEAYRLLDDQFGQQAIDTLVARLEDDRARLAVIVAGYPDETNRFLRANAGLASRFPTRITFDDYSAAELHAILLRMLDQRIPLAPELDSELARVVENIHRSRGERFGNAREMRTLADRMRRGWARRTDSQVDQPMTIDDIPLDFQPAAVRQPASVDDLLAELHGLVGLLPVKSKVDELVDRLRLRQRRGRTGKDLSPPHLLFVGPPGTGKTTVAKLVGRILHGLGLLPTGDVHEASRAKLVSPYVGQTASRTLEQVELATGGVLFIDEAYSLAAGGPNDFGHQALTTLLQEMESRRGRLVVIAAGYVGPMERFLASNPGLASRFERVDFPDYRDDELIDILHLMAEAEGTRLDPSVREPALAWLGHSRRREGERFGNGREVRRLYEAMDGRLARRVLADSLADPDLFLGSDVPR